MLSISTKETEKIDLYSQIKKCIEESQGPGVAAQVDSTLHNLQNVRDELLNISGFKGDSVPLEKLISSAKLYLSMWSSISRILTFGKEKGSVDVSFIWFDSYTREKIITTNPMAERLAMLYNLAVMYSQLGANFTVSLEDKFKQAAEAFLIAAALFEKTRSEAGNLESHELGVDLSKENLVMCVHIMESQAQFCTIEKVKLSPAGKSSLLAKLSMQASEFYGKAYSFASTVPIVKFADARNFVSVLLFHEYSFLAQAYYNMACHYEKQCQEQTEGMGKAVANIKKGSDYLLILSKIESFGSPATISQFKDIFKYMTEKKKYLEDQNNKIYHECVAPKADEIEKMNYCKFPPIDSELCKTFEGKEVFDNMVPLPKGR